MLREKRPSVRYALDFPSWAEHYEVPCRVIWRQRLLRCDARVQRPRSAGLSPIFVTRGDVVVSVEIAFGFNSRRLHFVCRTAFGCLRKTQDDITRPPPGFVFLDTFVRASASFSTCQSQWCHSSPAGAAGNPSRILWVLRSGSRWKDLPYILECAPLLTHCSKSSKRVPTVFTTERDANSVTVYGTTSSGFCKGEYCTKRVPFGEARAPR